MLETFILDGHEPKPASGTEWSKWFQSVERRCVALTEEDGGVSIATVFFGHSLGEGPPLLFETMVLGGAHDQHQKRYSTWDDAEKGHAEIVAMVKNGVDPE
jgi:hypothetical protein